MENYNGNFNGGENGYYQQSKPVPPAPARKKDVASLVLGIVSLASSIESLVFCWYPFVGLIGGIIAIITGAIAKKRNPANKMAKAGLIMGIIAAVLGVICIVLWVVLIVAAAEGSFGDVFAGLPYEFGTTFNA